MDNYSTKCKMIRYILCSNDFKSLNDEEKIALVLDLSDLSKNDGLAKLIKTYCIIGGKFNASKFYSIYQSFAYEDEDSSQNCISAYCGSGRSS